MEPHKKKHEVGVLQKGDYQKDKMVVTDPNKSQQKKMLDSLLDKYSIRLIHLTALLWRPANKKKIVKDTANTEELTNNKNINNKGGPRNKTSSIKTKDVEQPAQK